ncbi:MAG TPA: VTT domain-containing protein [Mycobacteriales bacterium]|jgi:undecaprenyl-diphosphatase
MAGIMEALADLPAPLVCGAVFLLALLETAAFAGLAVPGETAVVIGGVVASQGRIPVVAMAAAAVLGAVAGDSLGFYFGRRLGTKVLDGRVGRLLGRERVDSTMARIKAGGIKAVVLGRFVGVLRAVMPFAAGASGMSYGRFLVASAIGGAAWGSGFTIVGYLAGSSWQKVERYVGRASTVLAVGIVTIVVLVLLARALGKRQDKVRAAWQSFLDRPRVARIRRRYARQIAFVRKRFSPRSVVGLQLTFTLVALAVLGYLIAVIVDQVLGRTGLAAVDREVRSALTGQPERLVDAFEAVHTVLSTAGMGVIAALVGVQRWVDERRPRALLVLAGAVVGGILLPEGVRTLVARPNPLFDGAYVDRTFPAFTSTVAAATAVALLVVLLPRVTRWHHAVWWTFTVIGVVLLAGFAELFTTDVYLSDVLGGAALGAVWGLVESFVVTSLWRPPSRRDMRSDEVAGTVPSVTP